MLAGEMAAAYVNGLQESGTAASVKHFAANNQEKYRTQISVDIDERTLREIYLKAFEIVVKKSAPASIMCAYNKVNAIWCSENKKLLNDILREEWGYEGFVVSVWGAVHDIGRALSAGLDLQMPCEPNIVEHIRQGLESGKLSDQVLDKAVNRVIVYAIGEQDNQEWITKNIEPENQDNLINLENTSNEAEFNRDRQHKTAMEIARAGITLLKNENQVLPLTEKKYKKIGVLG